MKETTVPTVWTKTGKPPPHQFSPLVMWHQLRRQNKGWGLNAAQPRPQAALQRQTLRLGEVELSCNTLVTSLLTPWHQPWCSDKSWNLPPSLGPQVPFIPIKNGRVIPPPPLLVLPSFSSAPFTIACSHCKWGTHLVKRRTLKIDINWPPLTQQPEIIGGEWTQER